MGTFLRHRLKPNPTLRQDRAPDASVSSPTGGSLLDRPADSMAPSEGVGNGRQGHHPRVPTGVHDFLEEAFPLLAEDFRAARVGLDITSTVAAERAELDPAVYRALEEAMSSGIRKTWP